ncbi:hypothetical protein HIM_06821 [Hirsutella minnesotensis 3608]|uniref:U3 small nucleolar RNA-associated protein 11 n=1 Tax=Hirsutella minnesotensis 3608 TaxID=1043627 RepID=A0A0F7ZTU1_9HYPO|nr:hypothetical protein HIM_06821 [Hirsutella minnesotensis 3608]
MPSSGARIASDYSLRAKDYNKKQTQLKSLRQKATDRNEDEFYFGMMSRKGPGSKIQDGKNWSGTAVGDRGNKALDMETVRLLKTQDIGYVRTMRQVVSKEVTRLEEQVVLTRGLDKLDQDDDDDDEADLDSEDDEAPQKTRRTAPRKIVFMDDEEQQQEAVHEAMDDDDVDDERAHQGADGQAQGDQEFERERSLRRLKRQLASARQKLTALTSAEEHLEVQRAKMAKTATSGGRTRRGNKIKVRARKR